jgi:hypothetical protein
MDRHDTFTAIGLAAFLSFIAGLLVAGAMTSYSERRVCRHTIQRSFGKSREEAQELIDRERREGW